MIEPEAAAVLYEIYERALVVLSEAEDTIYALPEGPARDEFVKAHSSVIVDILFTLRAPLVLQYGDLDTTRPEGPPESLLDAEEQATVDRLTAEQIQRIDDALLSDCTSRGHKVARIIGTAFKLLRDELPKVPGGFYSQRVQALVAEGKLDSRGDLDYMRFSEVRLARDPLADVIDAPLTVDASVLQALNAFRDGRKRTDLADPDPMDEDELSAKPEPPRRHPDPGPRGSPVQALGDGAVPSQPPARATRRGRGAGSLRF